MIAVLGIIQAGGNLWLILAMTPGVMSAHYLVEYRTHFTNYHQLVILGVGATEQLCLIMSICSVALFFPDSTGCYTHELFSVAGYPIRGIELIVVIAFSSGFHYNAENMYYGWQEAKDKAYATKCLLPYLQFFAMMVASSYSRFYQARSMRFIILCGLFLLYANANLNLCTMAKRKYDWFFVEPFVFLALVALDCNSVFSDRDQFLLYFSVFSWILVKYLLFMRAVVD
jgi:hypothetical protein